MPGRQVRLTAAAARERAWRPAGSMSSMTKASSLARWFANRPDLSVSRRTASASLDSYVIGVPGVGHSGGVPDAVSEMLATEVALDKLGARGISLLETEQTIWNRHVIVKNRRGAPQRRQPATRRLLIGRSDADRVLTLVIEETVDPTTWLLVTGWDSTSAERKILERS